jgi:hypothetical protein
MTDDEDDFEGEDAEDAEDGEPAESAERRSPHEVGFDEETEAVLVAGRAFDSASMTRRQVGAFARHVEDVAARAGLPIKVVAAGDLTDTGPSPDDTCYATLHVGLEAGRGGGYGPDEVWRDATLSTLEAARRIPEAIWAEIGEGLTDRPRTAFSEASVALYLTCVGPLAAATLGFGIIGGEDDEGPGEYMYGQDMEQQPHEEGVWGVRVGYVQFESPDSEEVDLSDEAHAARVAELGEHAARAGYYVMARYD